MAQRANVLEIGGRTVSRTPTHLVIAAVLDSIDSASVVHEEEGEDTHAFFVLATGKMAACANKIFKNTRHVNHELIARNPNTVSLCSFETKEEAYIAYYGLTSLQGLVGCSFVVEVTRTEAPDKLTKEDIVSRPADEV